MSIASSALCDRAQCKEEGGLLLPIDPGRYEGDWICSCCQTITSHTEVQRMEDTYVAQFKNLPQGDLTAYYRFLNELGKRRMFHYSSCQHCYLLSGERFHASHHLVMRMAQFLVLLQGKRLERLPRERMETQAMLCDKLLTYVARYRFWDVYI